MMLIPLVLFLGDYVIWREHSGLERSPCLHRNLAGFSVWLSFVGTIPVLFRGI